MEKVNQMNILRESNTVLRDEKQRATDERDSGAKKIRELELRLEPLIRRENEFTEQLAKKDAEQKRALEEANKIKVSLEEEVIIFFQVQRLIS